jgi:hypothetical protein
VRADRSAAVVVNLALVLAGAAGAMAGVTEGQATWALSSPLASSGGRALWISDGAGSWRLEIGVVDDAAPGATDLLGRQGRGWTLACAAGSSALLQPWGEPWREMDADLAAAAATTLAQWGGGASEPGETRSRWRACPLRPDAMGRSLAVGELPAEWNPAGATGAGSGSLRRALTMRGGGRGGPGLCLDLVRRPDGGLDLTAARWPGRLRLSRASLRPCQDLPAEAFLPIWSLAEIGLP